VKRLLSIAVVFLACASRADALTTARRALADGIWGVAARFAALAETESADPAAVAEARLVAIEALSRTGTPAHVSAKLDAWGPTQDEGLRYWRLWADVRGGRPAAAAAADPETFAVPRWKTAVWRLKARVAADAGDASAVKAYAAADASAVDDPETRAANGLEWARCELRTGGKGALAVLAETGALSAGGETGDAARLLAAELHEAAGRTDEARRIRLALVSPETTPEVRRRAGFALGLSELSDPAMRTNGAARIRALVRAFPSAPETRVAELAFADALQAAGDAAGAEAEYRLYLEMYPDAVREPRIPEERGWALAALGRRAEAEGLFAQAARLATNAADRARCSFKRADVLAADGRWAEAADAYGAAADGDATAFGDRARFHQADACERAGRGDEAARLFRELARKSGEWSTSAALRTAAADAAAGRTDDAVAGYGRVIAARETSAADRFAAYEGRGRAFYRAYRFTEAAADFAAVAKGDPAQAAPMRFLGALCRYGQGRDAEARGEIAALEAETPAGPFKTETTLWLAKDDYNRGEWKQAESRFVAAAAALPPARAFGARLWAARAAAANGDWDRSVSRVAEAVKENPDAAALAEALVVQGEALMELARFDEAALVLERALLAKPADETAAAAAMLRADALFALGADNDARYREALDAHRSVRDDPRLSAGQRLAVSFKIGRTLEKLHRWDEAVEEYYAHVVLAYAEGRAAGAWYDDAARAFFARAAFALADGYETRGETAQAVNVLQRVVNADTRAADEAARRIRNLKKKGGLP